MNTYKVTLEEYLDSYWDTFVRDSSKKAKYILAHDGGCGGFTAIICESYAEALEKQSMVERDIPFSRTCKYIIRKLPLRL